MFGGKQTNSPRGSLSVIGADVTIAGNIVTEGNLHIDGMVEGDVRCGSIVQGGSSRIVGAVRAKVARVAGTIEGSVEATSLTIEKAARIAGDLAYGELAIETGARVEGRMTHLAEGAAEPTLRLVDATA